MESDDDRYGRLWDYRVVSMLDTNPDSPRDQRYLALHEVHYATEMFRRKGQEPGDVAIIESQQATVNGATTEELISTLERMHRALDRPALILAEHPGSGTTCMSFLSVDHRLDEISVRPRSGVSGGAGVEPSVDVQLEPHRAYTLDRGCALKLLEQLQMAAVGLGWDTKVGDCNGVN
jgi:hypothetical protein